MYVYDDVKTQKLQVRGTPCKCCSRSQQQRSSPGLRLRLTALLVLTERVWYKVPLRDVSREVAQNELKNIQAC